MCFSRNSSSNFLSSGKRGRPKKCPAKLTMPPIYVFIRNLLHNDAYNPSVVAWLEEEEGSFKINRNRRTPALMIDVEQIPVN